MGIEGKGSNIRLNGQDKKRGYIREGFYANRPIRIYEESSPSIRAGRLGLIVVHIKREQKGEDAYDPRRHGRRLFRV